EECAWGANPLESRAIPWSPRRRPSYTRRPRGGFAKQGTPTHGPIRQLGRQPGPRRAVLLVRRPGRPARRRRLVHPAALCGGARVGGGPAAEPARPPADPDPEPLQCLDPRAADAALGGRGRARSDPSAAEPAGDGGLRRPRPFLGGDRGPELAADA